MDTNYDYLESLLFSKMWRKADEETSKIMLKIANRISAGWLREEDFTLLPCPDIETIDELWTDFSQGRFGFTTQSRIWQSLEEDYTKFSDAVSWRLNYKWQKYSQLKFNLEAPPGHLPAASFYKLDDEIAIGWAASLKIKLINCMEESF